MAIITNIDVMLAKRKMSVTELAEKVGITIGPFFLPGISKSGKSPAKKVSESIDYVRSPE